MKKSFWRTLVLSLAIMAVAIVCWRVKPAEAAHTHSWYVQRVDREATCTSTGTRTMRCSCGAYKTETIPKKAHVGVRWVVVKSPGCTTGGHREWVCSCGHSLRGEDIPSLGGHNWTLVSTTPSTCTTQGTKSYRCSRSGCSATRSESLGYASHVGVRWVTTIQPGCTTGGKEELLCSCGRVMNGHDIPSLGGHNWVETGYTASTCQTHGTRSYRCSRCGTTTSESLPLAAHVGCRWVTVVQPTCYSGGKEEWQCSCGHSLNGRDIPTTAHKWVVDHTEPGNCIAWGKTYYRCQNSGCTQTKSEANIAPTGHNYAWMTTVSPTASANGTESYICLYCDTVEQSRSLYLISYVGNGGKNIPANQIKTQGVNITLSSTTPTREGYIFKGWGTSTGSDVLYQPGDVYTANARVKLSAVWEPKQFTVKYNLKGGKESGNAAFAEKTYVYGTTVKVASVVPTKTGYDFKGWDTSSAASTVRYNPGDDYTKYTNVTLYAVWEVKTYDVTFLDQDGLVFATKKKTYSEGLALGEFTDQIMLRYGLIVAGWAEISNPTVVKWGPDETLTINSSTILVPVITAGCREFNNFDFSSYTRKAGLSKSDFFKGASTNYGCNQGEFALDPLLLYHLDLNAKLAQVNMTPQELKDLFAGSCGIFATVNAALYLKRLETGKYEWTYDDIRAYLLDYLDLTNGLDDWVERAASGGDGPASICTVLQTWFADRNCDAVWHKFALDFSSEVEDLLKKDIPVIMSFDGNPKYGGKGLPLGYYELDKNTNKLIRREAFVEGHYFVVTGIYQAPNSPYTFFEISTWGERRFICYEEYLAKRGLSLFSTYVELKLD